MNDVYDHQKPVGGPLSFRHFYVAEYRPGEDELINYRAKKRKNGAMYEEAETSEALSLSQRLARRRMMKRFKGKIKIGRDRAKRRMANKKVLDRRAVKQAKTTILKKLTKGVPKSELSFARRQVYRLLHSLPGQLYDTPCLFLKMLQHLQVYLIYL